MIHIAGYSEITLLKESQNSLIYKGIRQKDNQLVLLKVLNKEYPTYDILNAFKEEYELLKEMHIQGVPQVYDLIEYNNTLILVQEYIAGNTLENLLKNMKLNLSEFFHIALQLTAILEVIHNANIIHKDINCTNIILSKKKVFIVDFGIATKYTREMPSIDNLKTLQGTLPYISPEQTGRMNRSLDYRTDFYSLGVTFFKMLTGDYPFHCSDLPEWVHAHIAKQPPSLEDKGIPKIVSEIVQKMLAKNAEDRYQSARGIYEDLIYCRDNLTTIFEINNYIPGCKDISDKLRIPEKLYGREKELSRLNKVFKIISDGAKEFFLCAGEPGIGKSALIEEFKKSMLGKSTFFISGKYDRLKRNVNIPYSAIIQALHELTKKLLSESNENLEKWKNKILSKLGKNGRVICEVIPEIEYIIGPQPEIEKLPPTETQNRFNLVFQNFMTVFAQKEHPLIIFLDDLQWADNASFKFIETILDDPELNYFLLIGAYRNNEVDEHHYLFRILNDLDQHGLKNDTISLESLSTNSISILLNETFTKIKEETKELAELLKEKTGGNPFFLKEFLKTLYQKKEINFNNGWEWNLESIKKMEITDNVVDLMASKIKTFPDNCLQGIKIAASIGTRFSLELLSHVYQTDKYTLLTYLKPAVDSGMIILLKNEARFVHDRIMEATRSLISKDERTELHYKIGKKLQKDTRNFEENIFEITTQLNNAVSKLSGNEKKELLDLNIKAALKAKKSAAYKASFTFFEKAEHLLSSSSWKNYYDKTINLYIEWAEAAYMALQFEKAEELFELILKKASNIIDRAKINQIKIINLTKQVKFKEAIELGIKAINEMDIYFPNIEDITKQMAQQKLVKFEKFIQETEMDELLNFKTISDIKIEMVIGILNNISISVWNSNHFALMYELLTLAELSFKYGFSPASIGGISFFSSILIQQEKTELAYKVAYFAKKALEKINDNFFIPTIAFFLYCSAYTWRYPIKEGIKNLLDHIYEGSQAGNNQWASYCLNFYCMRRLWTGESLSEVKKVFQSLSPFQYKIAHEDAIIFYNIPKQLTLHLIDDNKTHYDIDGPFFDSKKNVLKMIKVKFYTGLGMYYGWKLYFLCILGHYKKAFEMINGEDCLKYLKSNLINFEANIGIFFYGIILIKNYPHMSPENKKLYSEKIEDVLKMIKRWMDIYETNFKFMHLLISAEYAKIQNNKWQAVDFYNQSIEFATNIGLIQGQALAHEFAAQFWEEENNNNFAEKHIFEAYYRYGLWGAKAKTTILEKKYPYLTARKDKPEIIKTQTATPQTEEVDIDIIMNISQSLSEEIDHDTLLQKITSLLKQTLTVNTVKLLIEKKEIQSIPLTRKVIETREIVITEPKTTILFPLLNQGNLRGILYIDNLKSNTPITEKEIKTINLLSSQIAISLDNSLLYSKLEDMVLLRTKRIETVVTASGKFNSILSDYNFQNQFLGQIKDQFGYKDVKLFINMEDKYEFSIIKEAINFKNTVQHNNTGPDNSSEMAIPIISENTIIGVFYIQSQNNSVFEDGDVHLLTSIANHTAIALANKNLFNTLENRAAELTAAKKIAEKANKAKSDFLSNMSHELRTPLNAILGYAQILERNKKITNLQKEGIQIIRKSGEHLLTLITDILDLSKIEAGKFELLKRDFDLIEFLKNIEDIIKVKADEKRITFSLKTTSLPRGVYWDDKRIGQILLNLLTNAVKFTDTGSVILDVSLLAEEGTLDNLLYKIIFKVIDTGIGMNKNEIKKIFDPFEQAGELKRRIEGSGLGLAITQRLITMMNSKLDIESVVNKGSIFSFKLELPGAKTYITENKPLSNRIIGYKGRKKTVLIVDDNKHNRKVLKNILEETGFTVIQAKNGKEGVEAAHTYQPDFIMMDMVMPIMTGFEAIKILKNDPETKDIFIISISASVFAEDIHNLELAGSDHFLSKPININELFNLLNNKLSIEWKYSTQEKPADIQNINHIIAPEAPVLNKIIKLSKSGRIKKIKKELDILIAQNPEYEPFSKTIEKYIKNFDDKGIIQFIQNLSTTYPQDNGNK